MNYSFNIDDAKKYGVDEAIMLSNFRFWILKNKANGTNFYEGRYWTFNSMKAFEELFPFWSYKQIRRILNNLEDSRAIVTGNFNKKAYDRTKWYALGTDEDKKSHCPNGQMEMPKRSDGCDQKGEPIPDINTDIKQHISSSSSKPDPFYDDIQKYKQVSQFYQENYHSFLSPINAQALDELVDKSSSDLVIAAMKVALKEDNKRISYVEGIIKKWLDDNVTTLEEAREFQRKWQEKKGMTAGGKARTNVSDIRRYHGRSPEKSSYEQALAESAAAQAVWK
jgi:DnaD/phage-associated family protein